MRLVPFLVAVALGIAGALFLISERTAATRVGYRIARLECERRKLVERNRQLAARVARLKTPASLIEQVKTFGLGIVPPEEGLEEQRAAKEEPH